MSRARLSPAAARLLYNAADAWFPPRPGVPGAGDRDFLPDLEEGLDAAAGRRLEWTLRVLDLETRILGAPLRGFAWLAREQRRARLGRWEKSLLPARRRRVAELRGHIERALAARGPGVHSREGA